MTHRRVAVLSVAASMMLAAACSVSLNPQPLPPGEGTSTHQDSGSFAHDPREMQDASEANVPNPTDSGLDNASDGATPQDASDDADARADAGQDAAKDAN